LNFAIGWNRFNLSLVGIWPDPLQNSKQKSGLSRCRFMIASFFMLGFMCIPQSTNLVFIWGNADMMTENLATANIPVANSFMKAFTIWRKRKVLKSLVNFFYQDWHTPKTFEERTIMLKNAKLVRKISIWCTILTQTMVTIYIVLRISTIIRFSPSDPDRPMLYTAYFPFDITKSPIFELVCVCQMLSAYSATVSYTGSDSFISMLVLHVCGQFENLRERLKNLVNDPNGVKTSQEFKNLNFAIGWNRFNLSLVGIWPDPLQNPKQKSGLSRCRFMLASFFMLGFVCIPQSANLVFIWGNVDMMTENLATANIPVANSFMKAFTIWRKRKVLKLLVNFFYQDWYTPKTSDERTIMLKNAKLVRKISIWCTILTQTLLIIYIVLKISAIIFSPGDSARPMIYTAYFPFDATKSPIFELICACQILSAFSGTVAYTGSDSFISMLVIHVCGQFENLRERLKNLVNDPNGVKTPQEFKSELRQIVMRHEHLNWFAKTIEDSFNMIMLIQMLSCTIQLCFQGFQVFRVLINKEENESMTFQLIFLSIFVGFILVHLYIYCYVGEMLLVQSTEIGLSAYESNWFNVPGKEARNLLLIIHRSTVPLCLTAGKFSTFSLQMFKPYKRTNDKKYTGSMLAEIAKELVQRSTTSSQVLTLNLSNLLLLLVLKAVVFGAGYIGHGYKGRELEDENIVSEGELALALGYLVGDTCLYRAACEEPHIAREYLGAAEMLLQTMKLMPQSLPAESNYEKTIAEFRKAIEYGNIEECPPEYSCKKENLNNFLQSKKR
ncbi:Putative odorant receptor 13a, partial [Trachymyrmex cornetzi]